MSDLFSSPHLTNLSGNLAKLGDRDRAFASDLLARSGRGLSEKQMSWVKVLAERATGKAPPAPKIGNVSGILNLFAIAGANLKHPKIRLRADDGRAVCLSIAGPNSRRPGTINVTDGQAFGSSTFYGRVTTDGAWEVNAFHAGTESSITALLTALSADPAGMASAYGRLTGNCCFCNTGLTDERSTEVGYGPVCAKKWGLPWGK